MFRKTLSVIMYVHALPLRATARSVRPDCHEYADGMSCPPPTVATTIRVRSLTLRVAYCLFSIGHRCDDQLASGAPHFTYPGRPASVLLRFAARINPKYTLGCFVTAMPFPL